MTTSTRQILDQNLAAVRDDVLRMGELVDIAIGRSLNALEEQDAGLAQQIVEADAEINELRFKVDTACVAMIATQQPAAVDLRLIVAAMNIILDLERMGDHAAGIAKTVLLMRGEAPISLPNSLLTMAEVCHRMLRQALQAYADENVEKAYAAARQDDSMDDLYTSLLQDQLQKAPSAGDATERSLYLLFAGHNLERIADRSTNIAERVIFMTSGRMQELNPEPRDELA